MKCTTARKSLSALLDGALDGATADAVRGHIEACSACAVAHEAMRSADADAGDALRTVAEGAAPGGAFMARVLADIARREKRPIPLWRRSRLRPITMAASAVVVVGLAAWAIVANLHHPTPTAAMARDYGQEQPEAAQRPSDVVLTTLDLPSVRDMAREILGDDVAPGTDEEPARPGGDGAGGAADDRE